jgi:hypothetical protein
VPHTLGRLPLVQQWNYAVASTFELHRLHPSAPTTQRAGLSFTVLTFPAPNQRFFLGLAQQSLDVGEAVGKLDVDEGVANFDIGHEQPALIPFQPLDLKTGGRPAP